MKNYLDILSKTICNNWDSPALSDFYLTEDGNKQDTSHGYRYSYGEMYAEICRVAELLTSLGLQKGNHIAICGSNSAHWTIAYLAIAKMQGVSVTVMHSLMPDEIARLVAFSDAKALFTDEDIWRELKSLPLPQVENIISLENFESLASGTSIIASNASSPSSVSSASSPSIVSFPQSAPDSLAMICFTSGSTGGAKGIMLPYRSILNNLKHVWNGYDISENPNVLSLLPFAHMFGLINDLLSQLTMGKHVYMGRNIRSVKQIYNAINIVRPYVITTIPSLLIELDKQYHDILYDSIHLYCRLIAVGGAKVPEEIEQSLLKHGLPVSVGYGCSETGPAISGNNCDANRKFSCGTITIGMTCRIAPNGEILVKGENVMLGYYKDSEATAAKIDTDGWLHTGDKGHLDEDGYLYVEGRLEQDIIVLPNGENIHPDSIEALINALPEVSESIVLTRDGKLITLVYLHPEYTGSEQLRRYVLRKINPQLPFSSQLYDAEFISAPLARTEKRAIKRYLYS